MGVAKIQAEQLATATFLFCLAITIIPSHLISSHLISSVIQSELYLNSSSFAELLLRYGLLGDIIPSTRYRHLLSIPRQTFNHKFNY